MARVHNMDAFKALVESKGLNDLITFDLGATNKYIKTIYYNGQPIVNNGQQYNMSGKNHELFEALMGNISLMTDASASDTMQLQRANERGSRVVQTKTYVKDEVSKKDNDSQQLLKTKDLIKILEHNDYDLSFIRGSLIDKYSDDIDFLNKTYSTFDLSYALKMGGVVKVDSSHIITMATLEKINNLMNRLSELKREVKGA